MRPGWILLWVILGAPKPPAAAPPTFTEVLIGPADALNVTSLRLGDYDGDGDLDMGLQTLIAGSNRVARLYKLNAGAYTYDSSVSLLGVCEGPIVFADADRDGDLDLVVSGITDGGFVAQAAYYRNDGVSGFTQAQVLQGMKGGNAVWADFDNDGDLDLFLCGEGDYTTPRSRFAKIYRNDNGVFHEVLDFGALYLGEVAVGDYDRDGDLDFAISGHWIGTHIYRNDGDWHFTDLGLSLVPVDITACIAWADYDGDGDLDFIVTGEKYDKAGFFCEIYRNDGNDVFTAILPGLPVLRGGEVQWADYDNDGDLDLLLVGLDDTLALNPITKLFRNDAGVFVDAGYSFAPGLTVGSAAWGDYDNDGDLDLFLGTSAGVKIYRNDSTVANTAPSAPGSPTSMAVGAERVLTWTAGSDAETPTGGLAYDLRVGTTPGGREIMGAPEGLPAPGNAQGNLSWRLQLQPGTYYASVRTVDTAFKRSGWSAEHSFVVDPPVKVVSSSLLPPLLTVTFDRPPDPATVNAASVRLTRSAVPVTLASITLVGSVLTAQTPPTLPNGAYELRVSATPAPPNALAGLYAHWRLDEGAGTSTADASGNGHTGTLVGAGWTSTGRFGAALTLDQAATRVEVGNGVIPPPWTVSLWVKREDGVGLESTLIDSDAALVPGSSLQLELNGLQDRTGIRVYGGAKTPFNRTVEIGRWRHLVFRGTATETALYVDGRLQDQVATVMDLYPERIGGHRSVSMKGALDEIQVYGRALSGAEIQALSTPLAYVRGTDTHTLDGDGDGTEGGDFVGNFTVANPGTTVGGCGLTGFELLPLLLFLRRRARSAKRA